MKSRKKFSGRNFRRSVGRAVSVILSFVLVFSLLGISAAAAAAADIGIRRATPSDMERTETSEQKETERKAGSGSRKATPSNLEFSTDENSTGDDGIQPSTISFPAFEQSHSVDGVLVTVKVEEGYVPNTAVLSVKKISPEMQKDVEKVLKKNRGDSGEALISYAFDICILDELGKELDLPADAGITVVFKPELASTSELVPSLYHVKETKPASGKEEGLSVEKLSVTEEDTSVIAATDGFSMYVLQYSSKTAPADMDSKLIQELIRKGLESLASGAASEIGSWVMDQVLNAIFPDMNDMQQLKDMLNTVLANQGKMLEDLSNIKTQIQQTQYDSILNEFLKLSNASNAVSNAYDSLKRLDAELAGDPSKKDEIASRRLIALTNGIGISDYQSSDANIDNYVKTMYSLIVTNYNTTLASGQKFNTDLLGVSYECMRSNPNFVFEHQAWDALEAFQNYVVGNYLLASSIELLSLDARITLCEQHNADPKQKTKWYTDDLVSRKESLKKELEGFHNDKENVTGVRELMEKHKVLRQDVYRYFWVPGYEVKFYTDVESHLMPRESHWSDVYNKYDLGWDFEESEGFPKEKPVENFWAPFWKNSVDTSAPALSYSDYNKLLAGYRAQTKNETSLYELMFNEKLGNCKKTGSYTIDETTTWLIDRNDKDHKFTCEKSGWVPYNAYDWTFYTYYVENKKGASASAVKWKIGTYSRQVTNFLFIPLNFAGYAWFERNNYKYVFAVPVKYGEKAVGEAETPLMIERKSEDRHKYVSDDSSESFAEKVIYQDLNMASAGGDAAYAESSWGNDAGGWFLLREDGSRVSSSWAMAFCRGQADWYYFGADGYMQTGWLEWNGSRYYLNPVSDGLKGRMLTGWQIIDGKWYYFETAPGSSQGRMYHSERTPDRYYVGAEGIWDGKPAE